MGTFAPFLMAASAGLGALSTVQGMAQAGKQEKYQKQASALQAQQAQAEIDSLEEQKATAQRERQERFAQAQASQRAAFAAGGVSGDGSGAAVFDNLLAQSNQERDEINRQIDQRISSLQLGQKLNLLSRPSSSNFLSGMSSLTKSLGNAGYWYDVATTPNSTGTSQGKTS